MTQKCPPASWGRITIPHELIISGRLRGPVRRAATGYRNIGMRRPVRCPRRVVSLVLLAQTCIIQRFDYSEENTSDAR